MMPRRKSRSMSLALVEVGAAAAFSTTCCMAERGRGRGSTHGHKRGVSQGSAPRKPEPEEGVAAGPPSPALLDASLGSQHVPSAPVFPEVTNFTPQTHRPAASTETCGSKTHLSFYETRPLLLGNNWHVFIFLVNY